MNGGNPMDDQILGNLANEVNSFLGVLNQTKVGFLALFQQQFQKLAQDYTNRGKQIAAQQEEIEQLKKLVEDKTREIVALKMTPGHTATDAVIENCENNGRIRQMIKGN